MANLNWTKTESGYAADGYSLNRTPGKRWVVTHNGTPLADGKHFTKLADAKQIAEDHAALQTRIENTIATATDIAANMTLEQAQAGMAEVMGVEDSRCPTAEPITETAATVTTYCSDSPKTAPVTDHPSVLTEAKFCRPVPRESLTDQFTRLYIYADIGIRRAYLRETA